MPGNRKTTRRVWTAAFVGTLLLHALAGFALLAFDPFEPSSIQAAVPEPIDVVFVPAEPRSEDTEDPATFTELPEDRAETAPSDPDFLSNVDSRARDRAEGGAEGAMPRMEGGSEAPHVRLDPGEAAPDRAASESDPAEEQRPHPEEAAPADIPEPVPGTPRPGPRPTAEFDPAPERPLRTPGSLGSLLRRPQGLSDILQEEMANAEGNAALPGDISLNTTAWAYAPWLQRFIRDFKRDWNAPPAYYMGLVHGWNVVQLEIAPSGRLLLLQVLEEDCHLSLTQASVISFESLAPYHPLPIDFPEEKLILTIKLYYPEPRRR